MFPFRCVHCVKLARYGGGTLCEDHGKCVHCGAPPVNGTGDLCETHREVLRAKTKKRRDEYDADMQARFRYYLPDGTDVGDKSDECGWRGYVIYGCQVNSVAEFLEQVSIEEMDQDGGETGTFSFLEAPMNIQNQILNALGISWKEVA